jgi:hypothetical protein
MAIIRHRTLTKVRECDRIARVGRTRGRKVAMTDAGRGPCDGEAGRAGAGIHL